MRKLKTTDVFAALRAIKAVGLRDELKPLLARAAAGGVSVEDVGIDGFLSLLEMLSEKKAENALYEVLAGPFEATPEAVGSMDLDEMFAGLCQIARENNLKDFFGYVSGLLGKNAAT